MTEDNNKTDLNEALKMLAIHDVAAATKFDSCIKCGLPFKETQPELTLCWACKRSHETAENGATDYHCGNAAHGSSKNKYCGACFMERTQPVPTIDGVPIPKEWYKVSQLGDQKTDITNARIWVGMKPELTEAVKYDTVKQRYDLIPAYPMSCLADVYTFGANKYADRNWELGMKYGRIFAAIMRHLWSFWCGETFDSDSKCHHLAAAAWGCFALIEYQHKGTGEDDRPK